MKLGSAGYRQQSMSKQNEISVNRTKDATLLIRLSGAWSLDAGLPSASGVQRELELHPQPQRVVFDSRDLTAWDSSAVTFIAKVTALCREREITTDREDLPEGVRRLLELAEAVPEKEGMRKESHPPSFVEVIGTRTIASYYSLSEMVHFLGEVTLTFLQLIKMRARYRSSDLFLFIQECGAQALPIVTLISFLVGVILAFVGAIQLQRFGAQIYVADLVGIAMVREMGAMMTGIIMAGRTGAAFAAQLGTMKVTQEIDAFITLGFSPLEYLVLPRMIALCLMMPLLCLYSDFVGILGGAAVGIGMLDLSWTTYYQETVYSIGVTDLLGGVFKSSVYGVLIAISGCLRGIQSGRSASAVGDAATSAVVTGIVFIIGACGLFAVVFYILGI
jgi:phospholipid/cholesterol/gamma-HCH transport system permease protein